MAMYDSPPWRGIAGTLSCFVKITISGDINVLFENQVWARGLGQGLKIDDCQLKI